MHHMACVTHRSRSGRRTGCLVAHYARSWSHRLALHLGRLGCNEWYDDNPTFARRLFGDGPDGCDVSDMPPSLPGT